MSVRGLDGPLRLQPVLVEKVWAGDRLRSLGRPVPAGVSVGESWDVADLAPEHTRVPDPTSRVVDGPHAGRSLAELIAADGAALLGASSATPAGRFPLLVKLLDTGVPLSVQVHPPVSVAPDTTKTESWVVIDADPGATVILGVRDGVTVAQVREAAGSPDIVPLLREVPVAPGDVVHVPAGLIHSLGGGVLVAEVQTSSDDTYRLWDWAGPDREGRMLHLEEAVASVEAGWEHNVGAGALPAGSDVVDAGAYTLERCHVDDLAVVTPSTIAGRARVLVVLEGTVGWGDGERLGRSRAVVLPAACDTPVHAVNGPATVLVATAG